MIGELKNMLSNKTALKIAICHVGFLLVHSFSAQIKNSSFSSNYIAPTIEKKYPIVQFNLI